MQSETEQSGQVKKGQILLLSAAHLVNDSYAGFLAPLLPILVDKFGLSMAAAGFLSSTLAVSSSLAQPLYGYLADRLGRRYFVVLGPVLTAVFMSSLGIAHSYTFLVLVIFFGGVGTAFFHPQGAALAGAAGGQQRGFGMSLFSAGGNAGYALGPLFILPIVSMWGLQNSYVAMLPGVLMSFLLYRYIVYARLSLPGRDDRVKARPLSLQFKPLLLLWLIVFLRAFVVTAFASFIPLLLRERGSSLIMGGASVTVFLLCGAAGGLLGGYLSDRVGRRKVILFSFSLATPFLLGFLHTSDFLSTISLAFAGGAVLCSVPVVLVMAQEVMPERASTVSGFMMGLGWGLGGLGVALVGMLADAIGLISALAIVAFFPFVGIVCGLGLPDNR